MDVWIADLTGAFILFSCLSYGLAWFGRSLARQRAWAGGFHVKDERRLSMQSG
ncbi:MAG TPA: hypothetical protein VHD63_28555 [Ktedonobacteraceae bacterium]|nr:hypothetical protein [Ktedonobacteraceae bacterium]